MKIYTVLLIIVFSLTTNTFPQTDISKDRLASVKDLVNSTELIMVWRQKSSPNEEYQFHQRIYDLDMTLPGIEDRLVPYQLQIDTSIVENNSNMAVATGNFLNGSFKHLVAAWQGPEGVTVSVPEIEFETLSWTNESQLSVPGGGIIDLATGNFFGDGQEEFVLAFNGTDTTIHLQVFSFNPGSLVPIMRGTINDEHFEWSKNSFDIITGDFDSDGHDDIALLFVKPRDGNNWSLYAKIYSVDDQGNIEPRASREVFPEPQYSIPVLLIAGAAGDFDDDPADEIAFSFGFSQKDQGNDMFVYLLDVKNNLDTIISNVTWSISREDFNESDIEPISVAAGDLDKDNRDEFVLAVGPGIYVYSTVNGLEPVFRISKPISTVGEPMDSYGFLAIEDMDADRASEIVVVKSFVNLEPNGLQHFEIQVFGFLDTTLTEFITKAARLNENPILTNNGLRRYAIALGDFNGDRTRLGEPVHFSRKGIMQPTVVLYTPPIHYDIFDNTSFDLSDCYPDQNCGFFSTYVRTVTIDSSITTEIHEDWGGDVTITTSAAVLKQKLKATYGDKFSRKETSGTSYTISETKVAAGDDWIYATVYDIDFYEYPVYDSLNSTPIGYFMVSIPSGIRPLWIQAKDDETLGNQFKPDHEIGNILSYRTSSTFDTSRVIVDFSEITVGTDGSSQAFLLFSSFSELGVETSWDAGLEIGVSIDLSADIFGFEVGLEVEVNGHYNYGEIFTQTVKVEESIQVIADLGKLAPGIGIGGTYHVIPYAYWTSYGALALDYKVSQLPVGGNSFWQSRYGNKTDLAFSLPWRYDTEKGYSLPGNDSTYRYRSRDIVLSKVEPHGGDSVLIAAKVRNFGLEAVTSPFTVRFYTGNPNLGGTQIAVTTVDTIIDARGYKTVLVPWAIPLNLLLDSLRIYAVIDQENAITNEVHENNNIGWAPAIGYGSLVNVESEKTLPEQFVLYQSYPNPFNPTTTIRFVLPSRIKVSVKVYDILGREVITLADEVREAGTHHVHFDAGGLASGVYFYRIQAGSFIETKKMMLLK